MGNLFSKKNKENQLSKEDFDILRKSVLDLTAALNETNLRQEESAKQISELKTNKEDSDAKIQKLEKQFQKSEESNQVLVKENKDFKIKIEEQQTNLNKSHGSHLESLTYYNEVKANLNQIKEKYIKSSSDQILILTTIVGNLQYQKQNIQSRLDEYKSQLRNLNSLEKLTKAKTNLEESISKLSSECERVFKDEEKYNKEIKNIENNRTIFIKDVDSQISSCNQQELKTRKEIAEIFNDRTVLPRRISEILREYDRNNNLDMKVN